MVLQSIDQRGVVGTLPDACGGAVGGYHDKWNFLIESLRYRRMYIQQGRARGTANSRR